MAALDMYGNWPMGRWVNCAFPEIGSVFSMLFSVHHQQEREGWSLSWETIPTLLFIVVQIMALA